VRIYRIQNIMMNNRYLQCISQQRTNFPSWVLQIVLALFLALLFSLLSPYVHPAFASETPSVEDTAGIDPIPSLREFVVAIKTGDPKTVVGVYVPGVLALPIVQQPSNSPAYVAPIPGVATQFRMAKEYGTDALLAHNYLSGKLFFNLVAGQRVVLVFGDGRVRFYEVKELNSYQALSPNSPYSNFIDLANPGSVLSAADVFLENFAAGSSLVFQTCIESGGVESWGRLFVKAEPVRRTIALSLRALSS
jgi:hypothetical protein